ncbi:glycosyltransferase [Sphingopyxis sp. 22461]|uniref:glycosyltransferase n=1 Tax=Sphingopyxis sp. 22461 TaxID=3453923 RepID=UPI003F850C1E
MIFLANILEMNGGTTFLVRICEALKAQGQPCAVLVLRPGGDPILSEKLAGHARIFHLSDFLPDRGYVMRKHFGAFAPIAWQRLSDALAPFGNILHAMGGFGLIVGARLAAYDPSFRVTVGIYHQNEFLYEGHSLFSNQLLDLFRKIPKSNIVFFNESTRDNYIQFHASPEYENSTITPIGVALSPVIKAAHTYGSGKIISVGNLFNFKTYNAHIIRMLPKLREEFQGVTYHLYGAGDQRKMLEALADELHVSDIVFFQGRIAYHQLSALWAEADLFVGSGTALIEAAAARVPALVGIESIQEPLTYGFLSDVQGYSYNELIPDRPMTPMLACIQRIFRDDDEWESVAAACVAKAQDFSVQRTATDFIQLADKAETTPKLITTAETLRMLAGLPLLALRDKLVPETAFMNRRNQSFQPHRSAIETDPRNAA